MGFKRDAAFQQVLDEATAASETAIKEVVDFSQGSLRETRNAFDFALVGEGFFSVETPEGVRYTRNGHFKLDSEGQLILEGGGPVLGEMGPITVLHELSVNERGEVFQKGELVDTLKIVTFEQPFPLKKAGNSLFAVAEDSAAEIENLDVSVRQGFLEESNVDPLEEMVQMMTLFRYFEADQKALRAQDELLDRAANDIGRV